MYTRLFARGLSPKAERAPTHTGEVRELIMARLVMKFGGTSVADIEHICNVARHVKREVDAGHEVAVVVSAMAGTTDRLVDWCREAAALHDAREYDAVVSSGEQVTAGLLAIVLEGLGVNARSWQGWQLPILTSNAHAAARILEVNGAELIKRFTERHEVASRASTGKPAASPPSGAADQIPPRLRSRPPSPPNAATSIPMSMAFTPVTRASCRALNAWSGLRTRRCWSSLRSEPR